MCIDVFPSVILHVFSSPSVRGSNALSRCRRWNWRNRLLYWTISCSGTFHTSEDSIKASINTLECLIHKLLVIFSIVVFDKDVGCVSREFLGQGWMKMDKSERTPYIMKTSQHFNDVGKNYNP